MITDNGKLDYVDAFGTIYHVDWTKINDDYQVVTTTDTPFLYGKTAKHIATGQSPNLTIYALGRRTRYVQLLKYGLPEPLNQKTLIDEVVYVPVSPNALVRNNPFKYIIDYSVNDDNEYYCMEGSHFTYDQALDGELATIWPQLNIDGTIVANTLNMTYENIWSN